MDTIEANSPSIPQFPLSFKKGQDMALTSSNFPIYRDSILGGINQGEVLEITALYDQKEEGQFGEELAESRAQAVKELFANAFDSERIIVQAKDGTLRFNENNVSDNAVIFETKTRIPKIVEIEDRTLIYFPYNSSDRIQDEEIETYLKKVSERVLKTEEGVKLTGHTDSFGNASYNYQLGLIRARRVKSFLVKSGVPSARISIESKGETDPIASNNTEEGRSKNRRTELEIIPPSN